MAFDSTFAGGVYTITWGGAAVGITEDGPEMDHQILAEILNQSSTHGREEIDGLYLGMQVSINFSVRVWSSTVKDLIWTAGTWGASGTIGRSLYDLSKAVVFTAVSGTVAATAGPSTVTASKCILRPNTSVRTSFGNRWRVIPVTMMVLKNAGDSAFFTST